MEPIPEYIPKNDTTDGGHEPPGRDGNEHTPAERTTRSGDVLPGSADHIQERLLAELRKFLPCADLHVYPDIPPKKLANACRSCQVPSDETILALIDATVTSNGRCSLLVGRTALYFFNDHGAKIAGTSRIPHADLAGRRIWRESWSEVGLDRGEFFNRAGSQATAERIVELLVAVQRTLSGLAT